MAVWLLNLDVTDSAAAPDELTSLDVLLDDPTVSFDAAAAPDELASLDVAFDAPSCNATTAASPDELTALGVASDNPTLSSDTAASPDELAALTVAQDNPTLDAGAAATPDELASLDVAFDAPTATVAFAASPDELGSLDVGLDPPILDPIQPVGPDAYGLDLTIEAPDVAHTDTIATPDGLAVDIAQDDPLIGENDGAYPNDDITIGVASDNPSVTFAVTTTPDGLPLTLAVDDPQGDVTFPASPAGLGNNLSLDPPTMAQLVAPDDQALTVASDNPAVTFAAFTTPAGTFTIPVALTAPTFVFHPDNTDATPDSLIVDVTPGTPTRTIGAPSDITPIVPRRWTGPLRPYHYLGIGPWNASVNWRGAPNYGIAAGQRSSAPHLTLPFADSKNVTLRLNAASEASTNHTFTRDTAVILQENFTDLWWRRRDPRRQIIDALGRFNCATADINLETSGAVTLAASFTDYQGLLEDRLIMAYLNPGHTPPDIMWNTGTYICDILAWAVPTNMGIDLTGIQATSRDVNAKLKSPFQVPLGTPMSDLFTQLQGRSDTPWEWWVSTPASDTSRPRLTLAAARGTDRGVSLVNVGGQGPIESASLQRNGDKYANALYFIGNQGGVVVQYDDQIALNGQRDATVTDDTVKATVSGGIPYLLVAAAEKKLAELAAATPSYTVVLRPGFWEGRTHIDVGDWVSLRLAFGKDIISGKWRVSEIQLDVDSGGLETVTLTLGTPRPAKDQRSRKSSTARVVRYLANYTVPEGALEYIAP